VVAYGASFTPKWYLPIFLAKSENKFGRTKNISILRLNQSAMSYAGKNLRYLRKQKGWTQEECANHLQVKRSLIGAYEEERAEPKLEVLEILSSMFKLTLDELLLQDLSEQPSTKATYLEQRRKLKMVAASNTIHFVPQRAAAGYLNGYADPEFLDELNTFTLPMLAPGQYRAFEIVGDSMLPTPSGSVIVGEKVDSMDEVKNSNTYVVLSKTDGIVYKRIMKNTKVKNKLTLVSDNPIYEPYNLNQDEVLEVWKAVYILQKAGSVQRWDVGQLAGMVNNLTNEVSNLKKKLN
jgi:transcriptional regulator with XRE-family HTH domain